MIPKIEKHDHNKIIYSKCRKNKTIKMVQLDDNYYMVVFKRYLFGFMIYHWIKTYETLKQASYSYSTMVYKKFR